MDKKITQLTNYTTPTDNDVMPIDDVTATLTKKLSWANIKATLKTYFDTLYTGDIKTVNSLSLLGSGNIDTIEPQELRLLQRLGSDIKAMTWTPNPFTSSNALVNQTIHYSVIYIPKTITVTGIKFFLVTAGDYTADNNNKISIYSLSGSTLTQVATTADDGDLWKGTNNTFKNKDLAAPVELPEGVYFIGALWCRSAQTTAPTIHGSTNASNGTANTYNLTDIRLSCVQSSQTDLPATVNFSSMTISAFRRWFALY